ncbi:RNA guanine-N7 methyltransferase activating subunit [Clupea harengus]|uniref:RNA guanine-N7 methyltransferase activating subunit n=1 Tax=Clupea harengus TaxID=7950 RepID=A0A6P8FHZ0_CLUHA|nr:RNA guanine-N7 methyltransferase activating subunit [Clupea harengus]XP_031425505.1 RNA guanine-N7 methyltransferase activating subunit [Clupea harengus]XP_031425506.1 RNA guanine-N7 methyltransferase activating subunit [Clupea harengus]
MTDSPETLQGYEEQFACRFTSEDVEYQKYVQQPVNPPPIVEDWRGRSGGGYQRGRDNRYQDQRPYRGRDRDRGWGGSDQRGPPQERRWGSGGQYQGQHNSYNQGYNSSSQRRYERY